MRSKSHFISILLLFSLIITLAAAACKSPSPTNTPRVDRPSTDTPRVDQPAADTPAVPVGTATAEPTDTAIPEPTATMTPGPTPTPLPPTNPILIERSPARGEETAERGPIQIRFDQAMDQPSVEAALGVFTAGDVSQRIDGRVEWPDQATLRFTPDEALDRSARYEVIVDTGAKSTRGLALQREIAFNFATVGYLEAPFAEQTIVNDGKQSMPLAYANADAPWYSEAQRTFDTPQDWTVNGVTTLTIWFRGDPDNTPETLYVALDGNAKVNHDNPDAAKRGIWTQWNIDLMRFADQGVNLANVNSITLGLSSVIGGTGMMYFDDIRLYPPVP